MSHIVRVGAIFAAVVLLLGMFTWLIYGKQIDVLNPAGVVAEEQRTILLFSLILSAFVVIPVFTILVYVSIKYRAKNQSSKYDPEWGESAKLEVVWWGVPIAIIAVLGTVIYTTTHSLDPYRKIAGSDAVEVQVIGLQWKWLFIYPDYGVASLNQMPIPVDRPVRLVLTTEAPMSALWFPSLGSQIYAMEGMESELNLKATKTGEYKGYNTNINGEGYAKMIATAKVTSQDSFLEWVDQAKRQNDVLDMYAYEKLAEPEVNRTVAHYRLDGDAVYDRVLMRNMTHGAGASMKHSHGASHE